MRSRTGNAYTFSKQQITCKRRTEHEHTKLWDCQNIRFHRIHILHLSCCGGRIRALNSMSRRQHSKFSPNPNQRLLIFDHRLYTTDLRNILHPRYSRRLLRVDNHKINRTRKLHASAHEQPNTGHSRLSFRSFHRWRLLTPKRTVLPTLWKRTTPLNTEGEAIIFRGECSKLSQLIVESMNKVAISCSEHILTEN